MASNRSGPFDRSCLIVLDESPVSYSWRGCGRDASHPTPPAQIRTCRITAYGSSLGFWRQNEHQDKDEEYAGKESTG